MQDAKMMQKVLFEIKPNNFYCGDKAHVDYQ
jgi:hypothetical protein